MSPAEFANKPFELSMFLDDDAPNLTPRQHCELVMTTFYLGIRDIAERHNLSDDDAFDLLFTYIANYIRKHRIIRKSKRELFYQTYCNYVLSSKKVEASTSL